MKTEKLKLKTKSKLKASLKRSKHYLNCAKFLLNIHKEIKVDIEKRYPDLFIGANPCGCVLLEDIKSDLHHRNRCDYNIIFPEYWKFEPENHKDEKRFFDEYSDSDAEDLQRATAFLLAYEMAKDKYNW